MQSLAGLQAAEQPAPAATPIAQAGLDAAPAASLDRPEVVNGPGRIDGQVRPTAYTTSIAPLYQAPADARPLPVGPPAGQSPAAVTPYSWRPATGDPATLAVQQGGPAGVGPSLSPGGTTVLPPPTPMPRADGQMPRADGEPANVPPGTPSYPPAGMPVYPGIGGYPPVGVPGAPLVGVPGPIPGGGFPGGCCGDPCCPGVCGPDVCCPPACCDGCCGCCCGMGDCCCPPANRFYGSAEYLLWWVRGTPVPTLVTSGSFNDAIPGALGQPGTRILFGGGDTGSGARSGFRGTAGYWLNDDHTLGVEVSGFFLFAQNTNFSATTLGSPGSTILTRPFFDVLLGIPSAQLVAAPGLLAGTVSVHNSSQLWGGEANLRSNLCCGCNWYFDGLLGFRYLALDETLNVNENLTTLTAIPFGSLTIPSGSSVALADHFGTHNRFYGTQIGGYGEYKYGPWSVGMKATVALGTTQQTVDISGATLVNVPGSPPRAFGTGFLAESSNIGRRTRDLFGVVPEVGVTLGYQFTDHIRAFAGYNFLYWSSVARAGNQVDTGVNTNLIAPPIGGGPARPAFSFNGSEFWAQGVTFGIEFRY
jgi:hypothetical protein